MSGYAARVDITGSEYLDYVDRMTGLWLARSGGASQVMATGKTRFDDLVRAARRDSPLFRELYRNLGRDGTSIDTLPVVRKPELMARFDEWATDRAVTRASVDAFLEDRERIGMRYLDRYWVWKSSGTTGEPGIFVQDAGALAVYDALVSSQLNAPQMAGNFAWGLFAEGGRAALIAATGDHYAGIATWRRAFSNSPWLPSLALSVTDPIPRLVAALNDFQPALVASYPTMLALLAAEQESGRLAIAPATLWAGGEHLSRSSQQRIERVFEVPVQLEYGASEALSIGFGCREGWLHVNADWVVLEPIDRHGNPTAPGDLSHSTLLTNLANRVQPIIRYDLADRIRVKPQACACGNPLPAIQVEGRADDVLSFRLANRTTAHVLPMVLATIVEEQADTHHFQIAQVAPLKLAVRLDIADPAERDVAWCKVSLALGRYFAQQHIPGIEIALDEREPVLCPNSGKLRLVVDEQ